MRLTCLEWGGLVHLTVLWEQFDFGARVDAEFDVDFVGDVVLSGQDDVGDHARFGADARVFDATIVQVRVRAARGAGFDLVRNFHAGLRQFEIERGCARLEFKLVLSVRAASSQGRDDRAGDVRAGDTESCQCAQSSALYPVTPHATIQFERCLDFRPELHPCNALERG